MTEYRYYNADPTWANGYLWPPVLRIVDAYAKPGGAIIELGCGNGATAHALSQRGYAVTAIDPSESGVAFARKFGTFRAEVGSIYDDLAAKYGTFPVVLSLEVIEHVESPRRFMKTVRELLRPGGIGILSTPYHGYLKNLAIAVTNKFDHHFDPLWDGGHIKFFTIAKLRALCSEFGFERVDFHRVGRIPPLAKSVIAVVHG